MLHKRIFHWVKVAALLSLPPLGYTSNVGADTAIHAATPPMIDAVLSDAVWQGAHWYPLDQVILGDTPDKEDFAGRYALSWDEEALYIAAVITDDILYDQFANPLVGYWNDDCLEVFIDEDASGGDHLNNFNAFAYHVALDNQVVDIAPQGTGGTPVLLNEHIQSRWRRMSHSPYDVIWELKVSIYDDQFEYRPNAVSSAGPVALTADKVMGFMLSYCDSDGETGREHFIGSHPIVAVDGDKNRGYIDAGVFDSVRLLPPTQP
ncbi:sugar-binding protein [Alteromonas sp. SM 2104]|nr:sugar-binding protein [Alteromonas oceanisediminis]